MKKTILISLLLFTIILTSCVKLNDKNLEQKNNNENMEENIKINKENYLSYIDANDNLIYFKYSNLSENLKGIRVWVERYDNNEKNEHNAIEMYLGGNNVSILRDGSIKSKYKLLQNNYIEIEVSIPSTSTITKSYIDFSKYNIEEEKVIINRDEIKVDNNEFILGVYILNDEEINAQDDIDNFNSNINKILEENRIVFAFKGCFFE